MGVLLAQEFQLVRREVDDQQPAARAQHARRLADGARAVVEEVQHLMHDDDVEGIVGRAADRRCRPAARCNCFRPARSSRARASSSMSSDRSRPRPRSICGAEQFEHAAGAGAEIEQRAERPVGERGADRGLDRVVGDVQLADAVPLGGVLAEIGLRGGGARLRAPRRAARGRARRSDRPDRAARAARARPSAPPPCSASRKKAQVPSRKRSTSPASASSLQMARDARLRLAQDVGEVGDGQLGLGQQRQHAQARLLAGRLERRVEGIETEPAVLLMACPTGCRVGRFPLYKDIFIRLIAGPQGPLAR